MRAVLVVLAGLPGSGKSAVADAVARELGATVVSVDPIEAALRQAGVTRDQPTGLAAYVVAEAVAAHQLGLGRPVVVDAVNAVPEARAQWRDLAARADVPLRFVEVVCPDPDLHRARLEGRRRDLPGFPEPTWDDVRRVAGEVAAWTDPRLELDSSRPLGELVETVLADLRALTARPPVDQLHRQPGDGWVTCGDHRHWGLHGAGGLFLARGERGTPVTHVALQHRALWSDQGGTWGIPGGAVATGEPAAAGALREAQEEAGIDPADVDVVGTQVLDHGVWSYTTVVGRERAGAHVDPRATDPEGIEVRWVSLDELGDLPLLPAFAAALPALLQIAHAAPARG